MPRRARRNLKSKYLHVICQGINKEFIFNKKEHLEEYYKLMQIKKEKFDVEVLAYCIMNNHVHMLLYSEEIYNISHYMSALNTAYAHYYNKIEKRVGYVFRNRFLSEPIVSGRQLYNCISYIHYNPVKAKMVLYPQDYKYSSYKDYAKKTGFVSDKVIRLIFGGINKYMEMFNFIHYGVGEAMEPIEKNPENYTDIYHYNCKNENEIKEKSFELKKLNVSNRRIAQILNVSRNKINKILKDKE